MKSAQGSAVLVLAMLGAAGLAGCGSSKQPAGRIGADLILHNGKVVTVDQAFDIHRAIAIRGDRILAVGDDAGMLALAGPDTRVVDLQGKTVIPGLIDDHHHFLDKAIDAHLSVEVSLVGSIAEMVDKVKEKVATTPAGELVYTTCGWTAEQFTEKRQPTRHDLDPVSPNHPVIVCGGKKLILNSYALKQAGIDKATRAPAGGAIERDPQTGELTGLLVENAIKLANRWTLGAATDEQKLMALRAAQRKANSVGITGIREPGLTAEGMRVFQQLRDSGDMSIRVSMSYSLDPSKPTEELVKQLEVWGVSTGFGDHMLRLDGIGEFALDGEFDGGLMSEHYAHAPGGEAPETYFGLQRIPTDKFEKVVQAMSRLGWRASIHVVGDRGLDLALDAYEKANRIAPIAPKRWVIEHGHFTRPDQFQRIKDLGLSISTQFHPYMAARSMVHYWGEERASKAMRMRDWLDAGLKVGGGSDWSLMPANPFWMIYFWVTRDTRLGGLAGPDQRITREEALRVMTINNAYLTFEEDIKGSLEPGKLADLVVLTEDVMTVPEDRIRDIGVLATLLGGKVVYQKEGGAVRLD